ncbi:MAG: hypothetical protein EOO26_07790 [Comamonadaceae bacterium]|nr:MAG: hypothetical protein EOO26_07790 [Comamonadaceae bacterium]
MVKAIVIAAEAGERRFACETDNGLCAVFTQVSGPAVEAGDILDGAVLSLGPQTLHRAGEECLALGESAMLCRADALALLKAPAPFRSA